MKHNKHETLAELNNRPSDATKQDPRTTYLELYDAIAHENYHTYEALAEKTNRINDAAEQGRRITYLELHDLTAHEIDIELAEFIDRNSDCMDEFNKWRWTKYAKSAVSDIKEMAKDLKQADIEMLVARYKFFGSFYRIVEKQKLHC